MKEKQRGQSRTLHMLTAKENSNVPVTAFAHFHKRSDPREFARLFSLIVPINGFPVSILIPL